MKVVTLKSPGGLDNLQLSEQEAPGEPGPGEIRVRLHASSLNFHDYLVAAGGIPTADGRIPMSDGAGVVEAVGRASRSSRRAMPWSPPSSRPGWRGRPGWATSPLHPATGSMATPGSRWWRRPPPLLASRRGGTMPSRPP